MASIITEKETEKAAVILEKEEAKPEEVPPKNTTYASKKAVAQRMMDIALLTSNANQLRYVLRYGTVSAQFAIAVTLITLSLALQVIVGIFLIFRIKSHSTKLDKERAHGYVVAGVFLITIVNVLASAFSVDDVPFEATGAITLNTPTSINSPSPDVTSSQPKTAPE